MKRIIFLQNLCLSYVMVIWLCSIYNPHINPKGIQEYRFIVHLIQTFSYFNLLIFCGFLKNNLRVAYFRLICIDMSYHDLAEVFGEEAAEDREGVAAGKTEVEGEGVEASGPSENGTRAMEIR